MASTTVNTTAADTGRTNEDRSAFRNSTATYGTEKTRIHNRAAGPRFRAGAWFRLHGLDIITLAAMGAVGLGIYYAGPAPHRSFPIYNLDGAIADPSIAYPIRDNIIPIYASALISFFVPLFFISLFQWKRRSIDDCLTTTLGLLKSLVTAAVFQVFIKWLIGGLRPHFLAACQPSISPGEFSGNGFQGIMFDRTICTGDPERIDDALMSMPSGHATAAWAGLFYLALYFNAQLKVVAAHNPAYWKMVMFFAPILGAFLISGSLTIDKYHHWYDVLVGGLIGIATAIVAFRQTFAAVYDYRFNHILLPRATSLFHRTPFLPRPNHGPYFTYQLMPEFTPQDLPVSREGGWGYGGGEPSNGAPGDATAISGGLGSGFGHGGLHHGAGYGKGFGTGTTSTEPRTSGVGHDPVLGHNAPVGTGHHQPLGQHTAPPVGHNAV